MYNFNHDFLKTVSCWKDYKFRLEIYSLKAFQILYRLSLGQKKSGFGWYIRIYLHLNVF